MRIKVSIENKENIKLKIDYRRYFISFIKQVFQNTDLFKEIYKQKKYKPFVFSTYFENGFKIDQTINASNKISLFFSSIDPVIFTNFYNGLITLKNNIKDKYLKISNLELQIKNIEILNYKKVNSNRIIVKSLGICVLTNPESYKKELKKFYILPNDNPNKFNQILLITTNKKYKFLTNKPNFYNIKINLIQNEKESIKEIFVKHYNGYIRGFKGTFELEGDKEILQFIYDYGLGIRTAQGFDLLHIIKEL